MSILARYKDHLISISSEQDDDGTTKLYHDVTFPDGNKRTAPFSPYHGRFASDVAAWIEVGAPTRSELHALGVRGNLFDDDMKRLWNEKIGEGTPYPSTEPA